MSRAHIGPWSNTGVAADCLVCQWRMMSITRHGTICAIEIRGSTFACKNGDLHHTGRRRWPSTSAHASSRLAGPRTTSPS